MSKMLLGQLKNGQDYSCLNRTVTINILNFNYLDDESFIKCHGLFEKETEEFMKTDGEIKEAMDVLYKISGDKEAVMLAEMREKAMMDEQSRFNGATREARREGRIEVLKETIIDNLSELGNVPQNLIDLINEQDNIDVLKSWTKIAARAESLDEFGEKIK